MPRGQSIASLQKRRAQLEAELKEIEARTQSELERHAMLVGRAVLEHAEQDRQFAEQLRAILEGRIDSPRDRRLLDLPARRRSQGRRRRNAKPEQQDE